MESPSVTTWYVSTAKVPGNVRSLIILSLSLEWVFCD